MNDYSIDEEINRVEFPMGKLLEILFTLASIAYVSYHLYNGNYGFRNYINKQIIIKQKNVECVNIEKEISEIRNKIDSLQDDNLDSDLLDEEIRKNTSYAKKNEIIIYSSDLNEL